MTPWEFFNKYLFNCHCSCWFPCGIYLNLEVKGVGQNACNGNSCSICEKLIVFAYHCVVFIAANLHNYSAGYQLYMSNFDGQSGEGAGEKLSKKGTIFDAAFYPHGFCVNPVGVLTTADFGWEEFEGHQDDDCVIVTIHSLIIMFLCVQC